MSRLFQTEVFVVVVEEGTFTAAGKHLGITKSYTSKLISQLEDRLGVRLLNRTTRQLSLTDPGRQYYSRCAEMMQLLKEAEDAATLLQNTLKGRLRLTLPSGLGLTYLAAPLAAFKKLHPELCVEVIFSDRRVDLLAEGFDLAIRAGATPDSGLIARHLAMIDYKVCGSEEYFAKHGVPTTPSDLFTHDCLLYAYHSAPTRWNFQRGEDKVTVEVLGSFVTNSGDMLIEAAKQGLGIIYIPYFHSALSIHEGTLVSVLDDWGRQTKLSAIFPHTRHLSTKVRVFIDFFVEFFKKSPWDFA